MSLRYAHVITDTMSDKYGYKPVFGHDMGLVLSFLTNNQTLTAFRVTMNSQQTPHTHTRAQMVYYSLKF